MIRWLITAQVDPSSAHHFWIDEPEQRPLIAVLTDFLATHPGIEVIACMKLRPQ